MSMLEITGLSHSFGDGQLFRDAELTLNKGEHVGVVGQNGAGKSTLIKICAGLTVPDQGAVSWLPRAAVGYLDQYARTGPDLTIREYLRTAFRDLYSLEQRMDGLYQKAAEGDTDALEFAAQAQEELEARGFYTADTRIEQVASGLGLLPLGLDRPLREMSGGQRAKAILAKLLLEQPDVLLLDEPTNFLDQEHVNWLAAYLAGLENAFLVVSHDRAFLERAVNRVCDVDHGKITKYTGSYSEYLSKKALRQEDYLRQYTAQQREIKETEEFIRRNIAGRKSRMAKGRRKQLERMDRLEALDLTEITPELSFPALPLGEAAPLTLEDLSVGYTAPVLSHLNFSLKVGEKAVVTGFNGAGKTTLVRTLTGQLAPLAGRFSLSPQAVVGYFEQDLAWEDGSRTPLEVVSAAFPALENKAVRRHLFRCGISKKHAAQAVDTLSGGEQAKVKLCLLTLRPCNFLILDEPTNHLDQQAKEALREALARFPGTVLLVSHEEAFYRDWAQRVIPV